MDTVYLEWFRSVACACYSAAASSLSDSDFKPPWLQLLFSLPHLHARECVWVLCAGIGRAPQLGFSFAEHWQQMPEEENVFPLRLRIVNIEAPALTDCFPSFKCILQAPWLSPLCKFLTQTPLRVPLYAILSSSSLSLFNSFFYQLTFSSAVLSATYSSCAGCISWCWPWPQKGKAVKKKIRVSKILEE